VELDQVKVYQDVVKAASHSLVYASLHELEVFGSVYFETDDTKNSRSANEVFGVERMDQSTCITQQRRSTLKLTPRLCPGIEL
ncbi:hypothetical protein Tco_1425030, partial [Tanacetum coccineum]